MSKLPLDIICKILTEFDGRWFYTGTKTNRWIFRRYVKESTESLYCRIRDAYGELYPIQYRTQFTHSRWIVLIEKFVDVYNENKGRGYWGVSPERYSAHSGGFATHTDFYQPETSKMPQHINKTHRIRLTYVFDSEEYLWENQMLYIDEYGVEKWCAIRNIHYGKPRSEQAALCPL